MGLALDNAFRLTALPVCLLVVLMMQHTGAAPPSSTTESGISAATVTPLRRRPSISRYEQGLQDYDEEVASHQEEKIPILQDDFFTPSTLILTMLRTFVDVLKRVNTKRIDSRKENRTRDQLSERIKGVNGMVLRGNGTHLIRNRTENAESSFGNNGTISKRNETVLTSDETEIAGNSFGNIGTFSKRNVTNDEREIAGNSFGDNGTFSERNGTVLMSDETENAGNSSARGMEYYPFQYDIPSDHFHDHGHYHVEPPPTTTTEAPKEMMKPRYTDPWAGYYDFIITEGSFKFWSFFQLFTAGLLLYSALSAIYYAKFNPIQPDYDTTYDDYFFGRSLEDSAPSMPSDAAGPAPGWLSSVASMGSKAYHRIMETVAAVEANTS